MEPNKYLNHFESQFSNHIYIRASYLSAILNVDLSKIFQAIEFLDFLPYNLNPNLKIRINVAKQIVSYFENQHLIKSHFHTIDKKTNFSGIISKDLYCHIQEILNSKTSTEFIVKIIELIQIDNEVPDYLYKYTRPLEWNFDALKNGYLYYSTHHQLNDNFDINNDRVPQNILNRININEIGIVCLSANRNSDPMWAHYAECGKGFCIGFSSFLLNNNRLDSEMNIEDYYSWLMAIKNTLFKIQYQVGIKINSANKMESYLASISNWLFTKKPDWSYEKEVRMFTVLDKKDTECQKIKFEPTAIESIYIGHNCSETNKDLIIKTILTRYVHPINVFKSYINHQNQSIQYVPMNIYRSSRLKT